VTESKKPVIMSAAAGALDSEINRIHHASQEIND
jgi:hypothetical protein